MGIFSRLLTIGYRSGHIASPAANIDLKMDGHPHLQTFSHGALGYVANTAPERDRMDKPRARATPPPATFDRKQLVARQRAEMAEQGITSQQRKRAYRAGNEWIFKRVSPFGYELKKIGQALLHPTALRPMGKKAREDAWRVYLGLPQLFGTLDVSEFAPPTTTDASATFYRFKGMPQHEQTLVCQLLRYRRKLEALATDGGEQAAIAKQALAHDWMTDDYASYFVMGEHLTGLGKDDRGEYAWYYDFWDLDVPVGGAQVPMEAVAGWPIEFYDRIHFDRPKIERILALEDALVIRYALHMQVPLTRAELDERVWKYGLDYGNELNVEAVCKDFAQHWPPDQWDAETAALVQELCGLCPQRKEQLWGGATT